LIGEDSTAARETVLRSCGADSDCLPELLAYGDNPYSRVPALGVSGLPLADEPHLSAWEEYERDARLHGVVPSLSRRFAQLLFPIEKGISQSADYLAATKRGRFETADSYAPGLRFDDPAGIRLSIHESIGGRIPVLAASERSDFVALVRAFSARNEPEDVPDSMGACTVTGLNNWDRVRAYRRRWEQEQSGASSGASEERWLEVFREELVPRKELYQDRFIILSSGPYSGCSADSVGLEESEWRRLSVAIRREHEFTHYFTYRVFGKMRNNLLDELIADFVGLVRSFGRYRKELALRFLGIESYPRYREGGRLQNYCGNPPVSAAAFRVLQSIACRAVDHLDELAREREAELLSLDNLARMVYQLSRLPLEQLASDGWPSIAR
jgi:hypothetical protein